MKNVSNQFRNELFNGNRNFIKSADIKLKDGTVLHVDNSKLWQNGLKIEDSVSSSSSFDIGSAIIGQLTVTLNNIYDEYSEYDFTDAEISNIKVGLKLPDDTIESLSYGIYTVSETNYNGSIITLTAYDNMYKFDIAYSKSNLTYPATLGDIVRDACSVCDVQLGTASFDNDDFQVNERPSDESITFRNVLLWVAQISCKFLKVDAYGKLLLSWYNTEAFENVKIISGGKFNPWETDTSYDGGSFSPWTEGDKTVDGGSFGDEDFHNIYNWSSFPTITTDDVVVTGVKVIDEIEGENGTEQVTYQSGEEGYILGIEGNKLIQGNGETVCSFLGQKLIGLSFRPFSGNCLTDPTIEAGDLAIISDRKGNSYKTFITSNTFQPGNFQTLSCNAETPLRNSVSRFSKATQAWVDSRKELQKQKTEWEKAMEELSDRVNNSSGLYMTSEEQPDGSSIYYMHDKPSLEESMIVWKMTAEAMAVSTDGGKTYNAGLTVDGTLIAKIMNTIGINFDWGVGGSLIIKDKNNVETFYVDAETGVVRIVAESFTLRGKTVEEIASEQVNDFVNMVYDPKISDLQKQIDGQIETYYYDYEPTLSNEPASLWTTETERSKHEGDLFYWKSKGYAYRFFKDGSAWKWQMVQDTDVTKALETAAKAQDTADNKRRVFEVTPYPPYDVGDLWSQGTNGDLMICINGRQSGTYVSSDWDKASKYTDDTVANEALEEAKKAKNLNLILSNEFCGVSTDYNGNLGDYSQCYTIVTVYFGTLNVTNDSSYTINISDGLLGFWDENSKKYTVTNMETDTGSVSIKASYSGLEIEKIFSISKLKQGDQGIPGTSGLDGKTSYFHVKYSPNPNGDPMSETPSTYIGTYVDFISEDSNDPSDYTWCRLEGIPGTDGIPGKNGENGQTSYLHIKYSNDNGETFTENDGEEPGNYIGQYVDFVQKDSTDPADYKWALIRGATGVAGPAGEDGKTSYFHVKYSENPNGDPMSETPSTYIGTYVDFSEIDSTDPKKYTWSRFEGMQGEQGIPGTNGDNGKTSYLHIKYSDDGGNSFTSENGETPGKYIGQYVDFLEEDSGDPADYKWSLTQGEDGYSYFVDLSSMVVNYADEVFTPSEVTANAYYRKGNEQMQPYTGIFKIYDSTDGNDYTLRTTTGSVKTATYTFADKNVKNVRFEFYQPDGTTLLDRQTVSVVQDSGNGNLLKDTRNFTTDYWTISGQITRNLEAPDGSLSMASLKATNTDSYLSAKIGANNPISAPGGYTFSVWLRADKETTIKISLNHLNGIVEEVQIGTGWKQYNLSYNVETVTQYNQVTIGGWGSFSSKSRATIYIWDPIVKRTLSSEEVFNMLTNDGKYQGIYMKSGQLFINGQYVEFNGAKIGGWQISGNQLLNSQTNFVVRIQAPTGYGTSGLGWADVFTVHDLTNDTWPFVLTSDGTLELGDYFSYKPNGMPYDSNVKLSVGGWQIKNGKGAWGYDHFEYWDTQETQENGICSHGPWVIWGGWNNGPSLDYVNSYKFVVSDQGNVYAQRFYDNGQQLLPVITEVMHVTFTSGWTGIIKSGYFLLNAFLVRSDNSVYVDGIQRRSDGWYLVLLQQSVSAEADLYTVWCKNPD